MSKASGASLAEGAHLQVLPQRHRLEGVCVSAPQRRASLSRVSNRARTYAVLVGASGASLEFGGPFDAMEETVQ